MLKGLSALSEVVDNPGNNTLWLNVLSGCSTSIWQFVFSTRLYHMHHPQRQSKSFWPCYHLPCNLRAYKARHFKRRPKYDVFFLLVSCMTSFKPHSSTCVSKQPTIQTRARKRTSAFSFSIVYPILGEMRTAGWVKLMRCHRCASHMGPSTSSR